MIKRPRVLVVDDSALFRRVLVKGLSEDLMLDVVGDAQDAIEAKKKIFELKPDVVTLDVEMPKMSGIEFLRQIMPEYPLPIVLVSAVNMNVFDALHEGAVDFVKKPVVKTQDDLKQFIEDLRGKIKIAANAKVTRPTKSSVPKPAAPRPGVVAPKSSMSLSFQALSNASKKVIAIGASTGGTEAILSVVKDLPANTPGVVIVQHMPPVFTKMYADRLDKICAMSVREAKDGDVIKQGTILIAPGDKQMEVVKDGMNYAVKCKVGGKVSGHCPSVDVLFESVAKTVGKNALGVILTGMGSDGASGMLSMKKAGCYNIGQDKDSCVVYGMPMVADKIGAVTKQMPLSNIASGIIAKLNSL